MRIVFYVPGMPFDMESIDKGQSLGGSETMGYYISKGMAEMGHEVIVFANTNKIETKGNLTYRPIGPVPNRECFGLDFEKWATENEHDVLIAQRSQNVFVRGYNSKLNYWWTHDLALLRYKPAIQTMRWNIDRYLAVSDWHCDQVSKVHTIKRDYVSTLRNGIDLDLFEPKSKEEKQAGKMLVFSSRPERGLAPLVMPGGIMEQIYKVDKEIKLMVCTYENANANQSLANEYNALYRMASRLPNVQLLGALSKKQLADLMSAAWVHIYPQEGFEDTSCITAMETQAAGNPIICFPQGALPETTKGGAVIFEDSIDRYAKAVINLRDQPEYWEYLSDVALKKAQDYDYKKSCMVLEEMIEQDFEKITSNKLNLFRHLVHNSDITAAKILADKEGIENNLDEQFNLKKDKNRQLYDEVTKQFDEAGNDHGLGDYKRALSMSRVHPVVDAISKMPAGATILDYGCCVGHVTTALADRFPQHTFVGYDISEAYIKRANDFAKKMGLKNVIFERKDKPARIDGKKFDLAICCEVVEHYQDPVEMLDWLDEAAKMVIISTPYGPWEIRAKHPIKEHIHHFERQDLIDMVGHKKHFDIIFINHEIKANGEHYGYYLCFWSSDKKLKTKPINYERKLKLQKPRQAVSVCMISRGKPTLKNTVESCQDFMGELIIGVDGDPDEVRAMIDYEPKTVFKIEPPTKIGFDEARNQTIEKATCDWILWIDDDETFKWDTRVGKYLRNNEFDSYPIRQHHFSADPLGLMKTDLPCRLFRNNIGIKFYGRVHEHPEFGINDGAGNGFLFPEKEGEICHDGYDTEETRRARFVRNWPLMKKDRKDYPSRKLGSMLWIRDLAHINRYELERNGNNVTEEMVKRCDEGLRIWRLLLSPENIRLIADSMPYVTELVQLKTQNGGYQIQLGQALSRRGYGDKINGQLRPSVSGVVETKEDLQRLSAILLEEKIGAVDENQKYI